MGPYGVVVLSPTLDEHLGVAPRTAQAAMRHSSIDLTMNVYTDPRVLDVAGALDSLPALSLDGTPSERQRHMATGTDHQRPHQPDNFEQLAPTLAPNPDDCCTTLTTSDNWEEKNVCGDYRSHPTKTSASREIARVANGIRTHDLRNHNPAL